MSTEASVYVRLECGPVYQVRKDLESEGSTVSKATD